MGFELYRSRLGSCQVTFSMNMEIFIHPFAHCRPESHLVAKLRPGILALVCARREFRLIDLDQGLEQLGVGDVDFLTGASSLCRIKPATHTPQQLCIYASSPEVPITS